MKLRIETMFGKEDKYVTTAADLQHKPNKYPKRIYNDLKIDITKNIKNLNNTK